LSEATKIVELLDKNDKELVSFFLEITNLIIKAKELKTSIEVVAD